MNGINDTAGRPAGRLLATFTLAIALALAGLLPAGTTWADDQLPSTPVVDINTASAEQLAQVLVGVGERRAMAIVAWREANGSFSTVDELTQVKGIGDATIRRNQGRMVVNQ